MVEYTEISADELLNRLENPETKIIDIRSVDAYNGWKERNEKRGGHIKGAKSLPAKWAKYIDWIEIVHSKEILPDDFIIVYGYDKTQIEKIADLFKKTGYLNINVFYSYGNDGKIHTISFT